MFCWPVIQETDFFFPVKYLFPSVLTLPKFAISLKLQKHKWIDLPSYNL